MREIRGLAVTAETVLLARSVVQPGAAVRAGLVARSRAVVRLGAAGCLGPGRLATGCGGDDSRAIVNQKASRFRSLKCCDGDRVLTIDLKPWTWSCGSKRAYRSGLAGLAPLGSEDRYVIR